MSTRAERRDEMRWDNLETAYGTPPTWLPDCMHALGTRGTETCADEDECRRRHLHCTCSEAHEQETECRAWLRENPPDVDVNGESDE